MAIRIKSWKGRAVADMTRDQLIDALTESAQKNVTLAARLKEPAPKADFIDQAISGVLGQAKKAAGLFRKRR